MDGRAAVLGLRSGLEEVIWGWAAKNCSVLSTMACALLPPIPNEFTDTLSARSFGHGRGSTGTTRFFCVNGTVACTSACRCTVTRRLVKACLLLGLGLEDLMFGGIVLFSNARTALIRLVRPLAPSEWPVFGFT